jgi:mannose-6-phosphate isomerase-like protein (cupin superfamily)
LVRKPDFNLLGGKRAVGAAAETGSGREDRLEWWFLDTLVVEHERAAGMESVVLEMTLPVGHAPALHIHETLDDSWYVLEGEMVVRAGRWVSMPRGVPHTFRVVGDRPARILTVHDNATFRDFVRELGEPAAVHAIPTEPSFPPMEDLVRVAGHHGLKPIGPPMTANEAAAILGTAG